MAQKAPEVTFTFRQNKKLTIQTTGLKESKNGYHIANLIFPFEFLRDVEVVDPDNILGLQFAM